MNERIMNLVIAETELAEYNIKDLRRLRQDIEWLSKLINGAESMDTAINRLFRATEQHATYPDHKKTLKFIDELGDRLGGNLNFLFNQYACTVAEYDRLDGKNRLKDYE